MLNSALGELGGTAGYTPALSSSQKEGLGAFYDNPDTAFNAAMQPGLANLPGGLFRKLYEKLRGRQYEDWQGQTVGQPDKGSGANFLSYGSQQGWF